jgi:hypothetical protein
MFTRATRAMKFSWPSLRLARALMTTSSPCRRRMRSLPLAVLFAVLAQHPAGHDGVQVDVHA